MNRFFATWKNVVFNPMETFQQLPNKNQIKNGSWFFIKVQVLMAAVLLLFFLITLPLRMLPYAFQGGSETLIGGFGLFASALIMVIAVPFIILISWGFLFVGAGILHLFVKLFGGKGPYRETFQAVAYASAPAVFNGIPIIGYFAPIYIVVLQVIGINKRQKLSVGRSVGVVLLPGAIILAILMILLIIGLIFLFATAAGGAMLTGNSVLSGLGGLLN